MMVIRLPKEGASRRGVWAGRGADNESLNHRLKRALISQAGALVHITQQPTDLEGRYHEAGQPGGYVESFLDCCDD